MEISGVEPEMTICNIDVLPIKLYPPLAIAIFLILILLKP